MKICRIAITEKCNFKCEYCCMKDPQIFNSFKQINSMKEVDLADYDSFAITGGEPSLEPELLVKVAKTIRVKSKKPIYLYSNGVKINYGLIWSLRKLINGVNIGIHLDQHKFPYKSIVAINQDIPVRVLIWEKEITSKIEQFLKQGDFKYRIWKLNECPSNDLEDRFLIKYLTK